MSKAYHVARSAALAARDTDDAEKIVGVIKVGSAIDDISSAALDLAKIVTLGLSGHPSPKQVFQRLGNVSASSRYPHIFN